MDVLKVILTVVLVLISIGMTVIIQMQEGKGNGLSGGIAGGSGDSYVSRNKGRTAEGKMVRYTTILVIAFMVISLILNIL